MMPSRSSYLHGARGPCIDQPFARAVAPAQVVAAGTRSSIAALPAMVEGARDELKLPASATGFVLPLPWRRSSSTDDHQPAKLLFVAHVFGVPLSATESPGLCDHPHHELQPSGAYRGAAVPSAICRLPCAGPSHRGDRDSRGGRCDPDIFKTLINVTGDMSRRRRFSPGRAGGDPGDPLRRAAGHRVGVLLARGGARRRESRSS